MAKFPQVQVKAHNHTVVVEEGGVFSVEAERLAKADWRQRSGLPQGYVAIYSVQGYYVVTNYNTNDEVVIAIADNVEEAIASAKSSLVEFVNKYYNDEEEKTAELEDIERVFSELSAQVTA